MEALRIQGGTELAHAYIAASMNEEARLGLARTLAAAMLCEADGVERPCGRCRACRKSLAGNHPDIVLVSAGLDSQGRKPIKPKKYGVVTTGNEVFYGRIQDTFTPVIEEKMAGFGCEMIGHEVSNDEHERITGCINKLLDMGCELVLCTGGMSVDPDDMTPLAIKNTGADIVSYGAPVLPGAMFLLSYMADGRPVVGLPGCVMYAKRTIFDIVLPFLLADEPVTAEMLAGLGNGGLCLNCPVCRFPDCGFGRWQ